MDLGREDWRTWTGVLKRGWAESWGCHGEESDYACHRLLGVLEEQVLEMQAALSILCSGSGCAAVRRPMERIQTADPHSRVSRSSPS